MRRWLSGGALALLFLAGAPAPAQEASRIDPALRGIVELTRRAAAHPTAEPREPRPPTRRDVSPILRSPHTWSLDAPLVHAAPGAPPLVRILARLEPGAERELEARGATIGARIGDIVTMRLPLDDLHAALTSPGVRYLEAATPLTAETSRWALASAEESRGKMLPRLAPDALDPPEDVDPAAGQPGVPRLAFTDLAMAEIGAASLRTRSGDEFRGLTGRGVIVGFVDSGLDLAHEDFRDADERSRVLYAWDQSTPDGQPPGVVGEHSLDYGTECDQSAIDDGHCPMVDRSGHGTHVAGIAAGDGSATGNGLPAYRYTGVAPAAELIVVKAGDGAIPSDQLLEGVAYIFGRAAELGRPAVVNLSVSTQSGPHDGTTVFERGLDQLSGPGRIIVAGAGNQGVNQNEEPAFARFPVHAMGRLEPSSELTHTFVVPTYEPRPGAINDGAVLELWYDGADSLTVTVQPPEPAAGELRVATGDSALVELPEGAIAILNGVEGPQAINGDHLAMITVIDLDEDAPPVSGEWRITVSRDAGSGSGEYHMWLIGGTFDNPTQLARLEGAGVTNSHLVSAPATADRTIAVAAHATRREWSGPGGQSQSFPFVEPLGDIAFFSSPGPRRDDVLKPEISAPGKMVVSARAREGQMWTDQEWLVEEDGVHAANLGTSMSAPFVAGAVALLLEIDETMTPEAARDLLARSAHRDEFTRTPHTGEPPGTPNAQWGHGKLDVGAAARLLRPHAGLGPDELINLSANPVRGRELIINHATRPERVTVYDLLGTQVRSFAPSEIGEFMTLWALDNDAGRSVANGAFILLIEFEDERVLQKVLVLQP